MRRAFTLVEMLVSMVLTLILVAAMAEFYAYVGETVRDGRAMIEMGSQLRAAVQRLKSDFDSMTSPVVPWADDGAAGGYFEYREGPASDYDANGNAIADDTDDDDSLPAGNPNGKSDLRDLGVTNLLGDTDDYLAFTIRASGAPFTGRHYVAGSSPARYNIVSSQLAEVIWFTSFTDMDGDGAWSMDEPRAIHRRLLLIRPDLPPLQKPMTYTPGELQPPNDYEMHHNDISARLEGGRWVPSSLSDLTRRENRYAHQAGALNFPNKLLLLPNDANSLTFYAMQGDSFGEDVVLSNVMAFDVRIFDPEAVIRSDAATASDTPTMTLEPHDPLYALAAKDGYIAVGTGAYVDLGYGVSLLNRLTDRQYKLPLNQVQPALISGLGTSHYAFDASAPPGYNATQVQQYRNAIGRTYDTWAQSYERDGFNQDGDNFTDESTNGIDDDGMGGVDDYGERETVPPYANPPRGLQVKIRLYEASTRQMRQATVTTDFLAE